MNVERFRVAHGDRTALARHRPDFTGRLEDRAAALGRLEKGIERLDARQELLYARGQSALLLIFQGMDGAGKDSAITHVMSGVSPLGTDVHAFKRPSSEELSHDYLWRAVKVLPARGRIGIFNRSYYEDVLVVRVHPELLQAQGLPEDRLTRHIWKERFEDINALERHLSRNGTIVRKFFLHMSRGEQRTRLLKRLDDPVKNWKYSTGDLVERAQWRDYMKAYRDAIAETSTAHAPWYVIPADHKWFAHLVIAEVIVQALESLDLQVPVLSAAQKKALAAGRRQLSS